MWGEILKRNTEGFTLIELMIVIAIIGILAAIAIPQFSAYRARSFNATALADLRNAIGAQEAYHADIQAYANSISDLTGSYGLATSQNVVVTASGSSTGFTITAYHQSGDKTYTVVIPGGRITNN